MYYSRLCLDHAYAVAANDLLLSTPIPKRKGHAMDENFRPLCMDFSAQVSIITPLLRIQLLSKNFDLLM